MTTPTESMITRVARAMREHDRSKAAGQWNSWERAKADHRERYMERARIAIEAMRSPTEAMHNAADKNELSDHAIGAWQAMIDAALSEKTP